MKNQFVIVVFGILVFINSCTTSRGLTKKYNCLKKSVETSNVNNVEYQKIRTAFNDTLKDWMFVKKLNNYEYYPLNYVIKVDSMIFFNDSRTRALLLLQLQRNSSCNCTDMVQLISAEKKDSIWHFYSRGNVTFQYVISEGRTRRYSFEELSQFSIKRLIEDGLVKKSIKCKIDDKYITHKWFPEKRIEYHQKFLNNKY